MTMLSFSRPIDSDVRIAADGVLMEADWTVPMDARGVVIVAHASGTGRFGRRNRTIARKLYDQKLATLLVDLLTSAEEREDALTGALRFDMNFLAERLIAATRWVTDDNETAGLPVGYFGTGAISGAALLAAAARPDLVSAIVSQGGRPDLAGSSLNKVKAPALLISGSDDAEVLALNRWAYWRMDCERHLEVLPGVSHLFDERGALESVMALTTEWFHLHLASRHAFA